MNWADMTSFQRRAFIKGGVADNKSAQTIGRECGATRNAIIGWAHRNDVPLRQTQLIGTGTKHHKQGRKSPAKKVDPMTGKQRATRKYDFSPRTGIARPTLRKVDRKPVEAPRPIVVRPLPEKPTSPPVLFRGRRMGFECAFIPGDPKHPLATCCGAPVEGLTEWCSWHLRLVAA
jgi:hypothetical protein